eukprot:snap_masked-scaffold_7-processed-gene-17.23-mRNA-1 protein AED:0.00 eAED:0.00 QI:494/1/1/1/0.62/0.55/9/39/464
MGAQKGGTTALHSYLLVHPNLEGISSQQKELHLYDTDSAWMSNKHFMLFSSYKSGNRKFFEGHLTFESTPSYMASPDSCKRMNASLPPFTKFIFVHRDPVDRLWSEIKMKSRRVSAQFQFINQLAACSQSTKFCFIDYLDEDNNFRGKSEALRKCISSTSCSKLVDDTQYKFLLRRAEVTPKKKQTLKSCFEISNNSSTFKECFQKEGILREKFIQLSQLNEEIESLRKNCLHTLPLRIALTKLFPHLEHLSLKENHCFNHFYLKNCGNCTIWVDCEECISHYSFEEAKPICEGLNLPPRKGMSRGASETNVYSSQGDETFSSKGSLVDCFPNVYMPSDIARGFVFRGLYEIHFQNCLRYIDKERIFVLKNTNLRESSAATLLNITQFLHLPFINWEDVSYPEAEKAFEKRYPSFKEVTGWGHSVKSEEGYTTEQVENITRQLRSFYKEVSSTFTEFGIDSPWN